MHTFNACRNKTTFGVRILSGHAERYANYAAWVGDVIEPGSTPMDAARKAARRFRGPGGQATSPGAGVAAG